MSLHSIKRSFPNKSEILQIISKQTQPAYFDKYGRIYGFVDKDHWLIKSYHDSGRSGKLMWVLLSRKTKAVPSRFESIKSKFLEIGEELTFPLEQETISLFDYYTDEYSFDITIIEYPEISLIVTSSVWVEISYRQLGLGY